MQRLARCELDAGSGVWRYAKNNKREIDSHWDAAKSHHPAYFNGVIFLIDALECGTDAIQARLLKTDFKSYLFWRDNGWPEAGVLDGFGSALIRSCDGAIVLGRQNAGHVNSGLTYLPGGFIDARDVREDGVVDIAACIGRELIEETGLGIGDLDAEPGYFVTRTGPHVSFAKPYTSRLDAKTLMQKIESHIRADAGAELSGVVAVRQLRDLDGLEMAHYARVLVTALLSGA